MSLIILRYFFIFFLQNNMLGLCLSGKGLMWGRHNIYLYKERERDMENYPCIVFVILSYLEQCCWSVCLTVRLAQGKSR